MCSLCDHEKDWTSLPCPRCSILAEIDDERARQDEKWGDQSHLPDGTGQPVAATIALYAKEACDQATEEGTLTWADILEEEAWEVFAEEDETNLERELIQVAAVAVAWVEALRKRKSGSDDDDNR